MNHTFNTGTSKTTQAEKVNILRSILNGKLSFDILKPPKFYTGICEDGVYQIEGKTYDEAEFQAWKKSTLRDCDQLCILEQWRYNKNVEDGKDVEDVEEMPVQAITTPLQADNNNTETVSVRPVKKAKHTNKTKPKPLHNAELFAIPVKRTSGLLSEYGITWGTIEN